MKFCIECNKSIDDGMWCSMECKTRTFVDNFENSQWTTRLLKTKVINLILKNYDPNKTTIELKHLLNTFGIEGLELLSHKEEIAQVCQCIEDSSGRTMCEKCYNEMYPTNNQQTSPLHSHGDINKSGKTSEKVVASRIGDDKALSADVSLSSNQENTSEVNNG